MKNAIIFEMEMEPLPDPATKQEAQRMLYKQVIDMVTTDILEMPKLPLPLREIYLKKKYAKQSFATSYLQGY